MHTLYKAWESLYFALRHAHYFATHRFDRARLRLDGRLRLIDLEKHFSVAVCDLVYYLPCILLLIVVTPSRSDRNLVTLIIACS